jgi:hypothetical protein
VPATLDGVALAVVRLDDGVQRTAFVAWLRTALFAASCTQTARARLLQSVTARRLAAVATVFAQLVLKGLNPCLEVEEEVIRLKWDRFVSVRYSERLNSRKSSFSLQRTDRYEILVQKRLHFQRDS